MTNAPVPSEGVRSLLPLSILSGLLFAYVTVRACLLPITWDEAFNYLEFTRQGVLLPSRFPAMAANNHYLNSWLTYLTTGALGVSELTLRLPVLAAYLLFLYYTARFSSTLSSPLLRVSAFVILNANPYVLDFFSLSRGYGIAYGLLAGSLWHLYRFLHTNLQVRHGQASLGLAMLAVTAHLTLIHFLVSLPIVIVLATILSASSEVPVVQRVAHALRVNALGFAGLGLFLVPTAYAVRGLRHADAFFYGGTTSFWKDSVVGVFEGSLYGKPYAALFGSLPGASSLDPSSALGVLAVLLMAAALWVSARTVARRRNPADLYLPAIVFLVCSCALASIVQHHVLDVNYLTRRTALYLLILGTFVVVDLAGRMARTSRAWRYGLHAGAVVMALHLSHCLNLTYVLEWKIEADVRRMLADIAAARDGTPAVGRTTVLGPNLEFEAPINFYRLVNGLAWLNVADRRMKFHPLSDFYLYTERDWEAVDADSFVVVKTYPLNNSRLLRRKTRPSRYQTRFDRTLDFEQAADGAPFGATPRPEAYGGKRSGMTDHRHQRSDGITYGPDLTRDSPDMSLITVSAMVWTKSLRNATARLVVAFERDRRAFHWQGITVQDDARYARTWFPVNFTAFVPPDLQPGDQVSVYLSNKRDPVYIDDLKIRWITAVLPAPAASGGATAIKAGNRASGQR